MAMRKVAKGPIVGLIAFTVISLVVLLLVATSLLDLTLGSTNDFKAVFSDGSGIQVGDTVRIAGVQTGRVTKVSFHHGHAVVSFTNAANQEITSTTEAQIHYANLLGQRFLALVPGPAGGVRLHSGATIPEARTSPALDLTSLFNGFQPLFYALNPNQVNQLTGSIIGVFQGQSGTITQLTEQVAGLTDNLADRQQVIGQVIDNLSALFQTVGQHDQQLGTLISSFSSVVNNLAAQRSQIAASVDGLKTTTSGLTNVLQNSQPQLNQSIAGLSQVSGTLSADQGQLDQTLSGFKGLINTLAKVASSGSYINVYVCSLTLNLPSHVDVSLIPGIPAPQKGDPLSLLSGQVGNPANDSANCS